MLAKGRTMASRLFVVLSLLTANVQSDGTSVNIGLFTQSECVGQPAAPYVSNVSVGLGTCLATPGAVSINVPRTVCSGNDVGLYAWADSTCAGTYSSLDYYHDAGCYTWFSGSFGSIILSCDLNNQPNPAGYTTASAGPVATNPATTAAAGSSATGTSSGSNDSTSSSPSGWYGLTTAARAGIIAGSVIGAVLLGIFGAFKRRSYVVHHAQPSYPRGQETTERSWERTTRNVY